jgi:hypothetical protein
MSDTQTKPTATKPRLYAVCYPYGRQPGQPRTLRIFRGKSTRSAWINARLSDFSEAWGYRCTLQAAELTPRERAALDSL